MTRLQDLQDDAYKVGLLVRTYSPGDGVTRYRFFRREDCTDGIGQSYFGPASGIYTALGLKEARAYLGGWRARA
jgi:hypothetical protein